MTNTVLIKRSGTANSVPVAGNLSLGELAINYADGNLFYKNSGGAVTVIASNKFSSVTGNVTANNGMFTTIVNVASFTGAVVSVTGNLTGGNILTAGQLSATGTITSNGATSGTAFAVGNSAVSNVALGFFPNAGTSGEYAIRDYSNVATNMYFDVGMGGTANGAFQFRTSNSFRQLATINSTGITTPLAISATGNITGNYFIGNGSQLTGISGGGGGTPGGANTQVQFNDAGSFGGNGQFVYNKVTNLLTVGSISANTNGAGTNYAVGDDGYIGDINTADTIGIKGQQNGANGYIVFGNSDATAKLGRAGTGPLTYAGAFSATGNVTGGNILTSGLISATANVTANNGMFTNIVNVASHTGAVVSVTGNITGGNVSGTALTGTLATAVQTNITSVGTLGALAVSGNVTAGNVTAGSGTPVPSGSVLFNGTTQVLTIPDNAVFEMSGDFTLEAWFYRTATTIDQADIITKGASGFYQPYSVYVDSSNNITFKSSSTGTSWDVANAVTFGSTTGNVWNHVAVSRSGTAIRLFLNGSLNATITNGNSLYNNTYAVGIGARSDATELFKGYISTARIVKGVAVYTSAFTPATAPLTSTQSANQNGNPSAAITGTSTSLLLNTANGAGFLTDSSSYNFTVTNVGTATSQALTPFVSTSGTVTSTYGIFTASVNTASFTGAVVSVTGNVTGNYFVGNGSLLTGIAGGTPSSIVNGTSNVVAASSGNVSVGVAGTPNVAVFATTGEYVTGLISATGNVVANNGMFTNVVNVASHTGAVVSVTGNITGGNVSGTLLTGTLATATQTNITSVGTLTALAVSGNVTAGNVTAGSGASVPSGSVLFNGSSNYLTVASNAAFSFGTGNFTVEFWFNVQGAGDGAQQHVFQTRDGVNNGILFQYDRTNKNLAVVSDTGLTGLITANNAIVDGTWYHVSAVRSGTTIYFFVNGTQIATTTSAQNFDATTPYISRRYANDGSFHYFNGYISTLRVVKGVAVYTSAFTPATAPLSSTQSANQNGNPSAAITGTSTSLLLNTVNGAGFLTDSSSYNFTVTNFGPATSQALTPFVNTSGTVTSTFGVFTTSVNTASFTGAVVSVTGNVTGNYFVGNGSQLTGIVAGTASSIANGTSNIAIASSSNISMSVAGVADTVLISPAMLTLAGAFAVPKTLSSNVSVAGNVNALLLGPITLASGYNIAIPDSSTLYVYAP